MVTNKPKHILIAPLDWGLGHTSRCVPIIRYILSLGHIPLVAGNDSQRSFIEETFGNIEIIHLNGYNISYSGWNMLAQMGMLSQMPRILKTIKEEHQWLVKLCGERQIDGIISDNRYGLYHPGIPSVILTHQLQVRTGLGNIPDRAVQILHYQHLERFSETWIVDAQGIPNLGGKLSHPSSLPAHTTYSGLLSRFENDGEPGLESDSAFSPLVILLSGPEPQRSTLSRILWQQAIHYKGKVVFIEGSDSVIPPPAIPPAISYYKRLTDERLAPLLRSAGMVICRSGYSTLMDLVTLRKKAILIPTPGQTEQEYLGRHLHKEGIFYCTKQKGFDINAALNEARMFPYHSPALEGAYTIYKKVVEKWINKL